MTLIQLQYFQTLAYVLHFTRASELLHISQPSLSHSITELERELGVPLFEKEGRRISLTKYGGQFLPYVEKALAVIKEGEEQLRLTNEQEPYVVSIGYFYSIAATLVPSLIERFYNQESKKIRFHFTQDLSYNIAKGLLEGEIDLAFTLHLDEGYNSVPIMTQPLYLVVPKQHRLAGRTEVSISEFCGEPLIMLDKNSGLRKLVEKIFANRGLIPKMTFEAKECNAAIQFVALNLGVSILPNIPSIDSMQVTMIPIAEQDFIRTIYFSWPVNRKLSVSAEKVKEFVIANYAAQEDETVKEE